MCTLNVPPYSKQRPEDVDKKTKRVAKTNVVMIIY